MIQLIEQMTDACYCCGAISTSPRKYWLETGIVEDYGRHVIFCSECLGEFAKATPDLYLQADIDLLVSANVELANDSRYKVRAFNDLLVYLGSIGFDSARLLELSEEYNTPPVENFSVPEEENTPLFVQMEISYGSETESGESDGGDNSESLEPELEDVVDAGDADSESEYVDADASGEISTASFVSPIFGKFTI